MAKLQFNPSTLKIRFNPVIDKVQMGVWAPNPCGFCIGRAPSTCQIEITGVQDCTCITGEPGNLYDYKIKNGIASIINGVHTLQLTKPIISGICEYTKSILVTRILEKWVTPNCTSYDQDICSFGRVDLKLTISSTGIDAKLIFMIDFDDSTFLDHYCYEAVIFYAEVIKSGYPNCADLDSTFTNKAACDTPFGDGNIHACESGTAVLTI